MDTNIKATNMKYIHIRRRDKYKTPLPTGGLTIAYKTNFNPDYEEQTISFAVCSESDNYCKRTGRDKALDRFLKGHTYKFETTKDNRINDILDNLEEFFNNQIYLDFLDKKTMKILKKELHHE